MVILIAEDDAGVRNSLELTLGNDHEVIACGDGKSALEVLSKRAVDVVVTDHQMPQMTGLELIKKGKVLSPSTSFLLMTAYGTVEQAVDALRSGADDYVMKPFDLAEFEHRIRRIEAIQSHNAENTLKSEGTHGESRLIGNSNAMKVARDFIQKVGPVPSPVLILGPSGAGKEVLARSIHESGPRNLKPFIAINCASLSEQLMESELFGHEKGAFTGATAAKPGKFELAKGGTLFLDELGEFSLPLQAKLLRVLQEKEFYRVGGVRQIKSEVRVIAATNRNLKEMVKNGTFREDLYFRLNVLTFELPPLSQRKEDIPVLTNVFWEKLTKDFGRKTKLSPKTVELLNAYAFPGNVRELQNVLERLIVLGGTLPEIGPEYLPQEFKGGSDTQTAVPVRQVLGTKSMTLIVEELEAKLIAEAMEMSNQNQTKAMQLLGLTRGTLQYKLKKYGLAKESDITEDSSNEAA